eukprot:3027104-Rhodomonas_salina.1
MWRTTREESVAPYTTWCMAYADTPRARVTVSNFPYCATNRGVLVLLYNCYMITITSSIVLHAGGRP